MLHHSTLYDHEIRCPQVAQECGEDGWPLMVEDAARSGGTRGGGAAECTSRLEEIYNGAPFNGALHSVNKTLFDTI